MGVMGLGENGLKVLGGLDVAIFPPLPSPPPNRIRGGMEHVRQDSSPKDFLVTYPKP
jgi:hypothetical protein